MSSSSAVQPTSVVTQPQDWYATSPVQATGQAASHSTTATLPVQSPSVRVAILPVEAPSARPAVSPTQPVGAAGALLVFSTNIESNLGMMVIYLPVRFEFNWTKRF